MPWTVGQSSALVKKEDCHKKTDVTFCCLAFQPLSHTRRKGKVNVVDVLPRAIATTSTKLPHASVFFMMYFPLFFTMRPPQKVTESYASISLFNYFLNIIPYLRSE